MTSEAALRSRLGEEKQSDDDSTAEATHVSADDNASDVGDVDGAIKHLLGDTPGPTPPIPDPNGPEPRGTDTGPPGAGGHRRNASGPGTSGSGTGGRGSGDTGADDARGKSSDIGSNGKGSSGAKGHPSGKGSKPFISYVATDPNDEGPDPDRLQPEARKALEEKAIDLILAREPQLKRTPINNKGFDLFEGNTDDGPPRKIEVKAMTGNLRSRPVGMSHEQFECARLNGKSYWLYVVEHANNPQTARIVRIQDPAGKARTFCFDHGWISVAELDGPETDDGDSTQTLEG